MPRRTKAARMGRPPLPPEKRKRASMGFRPTSDQRKMLEDAAAMSGLSMTQEIERRLERSFAIETRAKDIAVGVTSGVLEACHDAFGGKGRYHIFQMIAGVVADVEEATEEHWLADRNTFDEAKTAILSVIEGIGPKAPARISGSALSHYVAGKPAPSEIGKDVANRRLKVIIGTDFPMNPAEKPK